VRNRRQRGHQDGAKSPACSVDDRASATFIPPVRILADRGHANDRIGHHEIPTANMVHTGSARQRRAVPGGHLQDEIPPVAANGIDTPVAVGPSQALNAATIT